MFGAGLPAALATAARPGVRIHLFNLNGLTAEVAANPTEFGFASGVSCEATPGCETSPMALQDEHFLYDQHPTQTGYALIARYILNLDASGDAVAAQASVAADAIDNFTNALLDRASLSARNGATQGVFIDVGYAQTNQADWYGTTGTALGYAEAGDPVLTQTTLGTAANTFEAQAGIRLENGHSLGDGIDGFVPVTAARDFAGGNRALGSYESYAPALPIDTVIGSGYTNDTYALFDGSLTADLSPRAKAFFEGTATAFKPGGNDVSAQFGLRLAL